MGRLRVRRKGGGSRGERLWVNACLRAQTFLRSSLSCRHLIVRVRVFEFGLCFALAFRAYSTSCVLLVVFTSCALNECSRTEQGHWFCCSKSEIVAAPRPTHNIQCFSRTAHSLLLSSQFSAKAKGRRVHRVYATPFPDLVTVLNSVSFPPLVFLPQLTAFLPQLTYSSPRAQHTKCSTIHLYPSTQYSPKYQRPTLQSK